MQTFKEIVRPKYNRIEIKYKYEKLLLVKL